MRTVGAGLRLAAMGPTHRSAIPIAAGLFAAALATDPTLGHAQTADTPHVAVRIVADTATDVSVLRTDGREQTCTTPCVFDVPLGVVAASIGGHFDGDHAHFVRARGPTQTLRVQRGSETAVAAGALLMLVSTALVIGGGAVMVLGVAIATGPFGGSVGGVDTVFAGLGGAGLAVGIAGVVLSGWLIARNATENIVETASRDPRRDRHVPVLAAGAQPTPGGGMLVLFGHF